MPVAGGPGSDNGQVDQKYGIFIEKGGSSWRLGFVCTSIHHTVYSWGFLDGICIDLLPSGLLLCCCLRQPTLL